MPGFWYNIVDDGSPGEGRLSPESVNKPVYYAEKLDVLLADFLLPLL